MTSAVRTTYKYELYDGRTLVYVGITDRLKYREQEHIKGSKCFTRMVVIGRICTYESARKWEINRLKLYQSKHNGNNPKYNIAKLGDQL